MLENIKARLFGKKYNIWTEKIDPNRRADTLLGGDFVYNGTIYYGNRYFVFFESHQNSWFRKAETPHVIENES
jgi:hypothetical protein